ncbi:MAG: ABC transporter ATP-binding protein [Fibrobacterota bacterium]
MIEVENIDKSFKKTKGVLKNLTLEIAPREVCGLIGLNGAGKTTLIRIIAGLLRPDSGAVSVMGENPATAGARLLRDMGILLEKDGFNGNLSFWDNLRFFAAARGLSADSTEDYARKWWGDLLSQKKSVKYFSRGERSQCGLARVFLGAPQLLILDEPLAALDTRAQGQFHRLVLHHREQGCTLIISSHNEQAVKKHCTSFARLWEGKTEKTLLNTERVFSIRCSKPDTAHTILEKIYRRVSVQGDRVCFSPSQKFQTIAPAITAVAQNKIEIWEAREISPFEAFYDH